VSITVDPEHDHSKQLLAYAKEFQADIKSWLFLTGTPKQIDDVIARFNLIADIEMPVFLPYNSEQLTAPYAIKTLRLLL